MRKILLAVLAFLTILLAACGSSSGETTSKITVDMVEFVFEPKNLNVLAGQEITAELTNNGAVEHDFVILKPGETIEGNFDPAADKEKILFDAKVAPGKSATVTFTIPEAGEYEVICTVPGHLAAGMKAKLTAK